jgi:PAS domain S-box-containing protein
MNDEKKTKKQLIAEIKRLRRRLKQLEEATEDPGKTAAALKESEQQFKSLAEKSPNMIFINAGGRVVYANERCSEIMGYTRRQFYSPKFDFMRMVAPESVSATEEAYAEHMKGKDIPPFDHTLVKKNGEKIDAILTTKLIEYNGSTAILGIVTDVTDRKRAETKLRKSFAATQKMLEGIVDSLAVMAEQKDQYTAGHQRAVGQICRELAWEMRLTDEQIRGIHIAGIVHDIGKVSIPAEIITKPAKLTEAEYALVKTHCRVGYNILANIKFPWPVARMVLEHHERINGSGYPNGLKGKNTLLESKMLAVADVAEAMSSDRPYRKRRTLQEIIDELQVNKGILYDPNVVDTFMRLIHLKRIDLSRRT